LEGLPNCQLGVSAPSPYLGHAFVDGNVHQAGIEFPLLEDCGLLSRLEFLVGYDVIGFVEDATGIRLRFVLVDAGQYDLHLSMRQ
jgi:hypothetical protein